MPHPKRKMSKTRRDKRRGHHKAAVPTLSTCRNCGASIVRHRVCPECGYYRNRPAVAKEKAAS